MNTSNTIKIEGTHPVIEESIVSMILHKPTMFYGEFTFFLNFIKMEERTCAVNLDKRGMFNFYFNPEYVSKLSKSQMNFVIIHEDMHLLWDHPSRSVGKDPRISNLAMDMIINQIIFEDLILYEKLDYFIEPPKDEDGCNTCLFVPKRYKGELIYEDLYNWLRKDYEDWQRKGGGKSNCTSLSGSSSCDSDSDSYSTESDNSTPSGKKNKQKKRDYGTHHTRPVEKESYKGKEKSETEIAPGMYPLEDFYDNLENSKGQTLDEHLLDELPSDVKKQLVDRILEGMKNRGLVSGNIDKILNKIRKSKKDYLKEIKRTLTKDIFGHHKEKTIIRPNRRNIEGLKGKIKQKHKINVILDTSGSMSGEFEKVLAHIFRNDIEMNIIQCDTEVKKHVIIKDKNQLQRMEIHGLGGTTLTPGLQYITQNKKLNCYNNVILTDGYTDQLDFTGVKGKTLVLSTSQYCPVIKDNDKVKQIIIEKDE